MRARKPHLATLALALSALLAFDGFAFTLLTVLTPITRQQFTSGSIVVYGAVAFLVASILAVAGFIVVSLGFFRGYAARWRIAGVYFAGLALFGGCLFFVSRWIAAHLP